MDIYKILEIIGVVTGLAYLLLIIRQNIWCWLFGIIGSAITVFLYYYGKLYLESILNVYYVWAGFYGWYFWKKKGKISADAVVPVVEWNLRQHLFAFAIAVLLSWALSGVMQRYTDSPRPHLDTILAIFSFLATFMEARKVLSTWIYWFVINGISIWLQADRGFHFYAWLSVVYTVMCIPAYYSWKKSYVQHAL